MSDRDAHLQDATVISKGRFKLDARRAMEKLAHFQLEDPHRYVLELVAAAVGAGARSLTIRNDADDLELAWDGDHPTAEELDALFDHIFYQGEEPRQRMLQHLAQGIYGALGLDPRWIHLQRPGLTLDLTDPLSVSQADNDRTEGVFVHVRERFSWKVVKEAISPFDDAYETRLLKSLAFLAPMPIEINGADITADPPVPPEGAPVRAVDGGTVWLHDDRTALDPRLKDGVLVVRDGVCVKSVEVSSSRHRLAGWVRCRSIKLNASRSDVVADMKWADLNERLQDAAVALVAEALRAAPREDSLREAALMLLLRRESSQQALRSIPLLQDANGREWSLGALSLRSLIWTVDDPALPSAEIEAPQFLHVDNLKAVRGISAGELEEKQWAVISRLFHSKRHDGTPALRRLAKGRKRRQELARRGSSWGIPDALVIHEFTDRGLTGIIGLSAISGRDGVTVELQVDDLPVQEITVPAVAPMKARIKGGGLEADPAFFQVVDNAARRAVPQVIRSAAEALLLKAAAERPQHPVVHRALLRWMAKLTRIPEPLLGVTLFPPLTGPRRSLAAIKETARRQGRVRFIRENRHREVADLLRGRSEPESLGDVLLLDPDASRVVKQVLGRRLVDRTDAILAELKAAVRRSQAPISPTLTGALDARTRVEGGGFSGLIGLRSAASVPSIQVIHKGVDLGSVEVPLKLPGAVASITWQTARPNATWDGLADPARQKRLLADLLKQPLAELAEQVVGQWRTRERLPAWVVATLSDPVSPDLAEQPWFTSLGGETYSIRQLKKMSPIRYLTRRPPDPPPGLDHVLILDDGRRQILDTHVSPILSAEAMLRQLESIRKRYFRKSTQSLRLPSDEPFVCLSRISKPTLAGEIGIQAADDRPPGVRIKVLAHQRLLVELSLPHFLPMVAVVSGAAVVPQSRLAGLEDSSAILDIVKSAAEAATRRLVADPRAPRRLQRLLLHHLLRRHPVPGVEGASEREALLKKLRARPLFPCLSGEIASLDALAAAHAEKRLRVVLSPGGVPSDGRIWVKACEHRLALLKRELGQRLPDGESELRAWRKAARRRETLPRTGLEPGGRYAATWVVREEGAEAWVGLTDSTPGLILEWLIEERVLFSERLPCGAPLRLRLSDPAVEADRSFSGPKHGAARNRAREWALSLVPRFMLGVAQGAQILAARAVSPQTEPSMKLLSRGKARRWALQWAAGVELTEAWAAVALVRTSAGGRLSAPDLKALASRGPLRVVDTHTTGMTLDEQRPAIQLDEADRRCLKDYGKLVDYSGELSREAKIQERRNRKPRPRTPVRGPEILLTRDAPGQREGFLQVRTSASSQISLHIGWRELGDGTTEGPVPLTGHISDDALSPDREFLRVHRDVAYRKLQKDLAALSAELLPEVIERADPVRHRKLLLTILTRAFKRKRDLKSARGALGALADLPLFVTGTGDPISSRQLAAVPPRWVPPGAWPTLTARRPFICASSVEVEQLKPLLGGGWELNRAEKERSIIARRQAESLPFKLPQATIRPPIVRQIGDSRALFGLVAALSEGKILVRCGGVPIETRTVPHPGLVGVLEVPERTVSDDWRSVRLSKSLRKSFDAAHQDCIEEAAEAIRTTESLSRWVARLIEGKGTKGAEAFRRAPLLETLDGLFSVDALWSRARGGSTILLGEAAVEADRTLVVKRRTVSSEILLDACGVRYHSAQEWSTTLQRRLEEEAASRAARENKARADALDAAVRRHHIALLADIPAMTRARIRGLSADLTGFSLLEAALAEPEGAAGLLGAAWVAEAQLEPGPRQSMLLRLGELLSRGATGGTAR